MSFNKTYSESYFYIFKDFILILFSKYFWMDDNGLYKIKSNNYGRKGHKFESK